MQIDADASVTIDRRYCGPPDSGNGGYTCGLVGVAVGGVTEVTLMKPPPLGVAMQLSEVDGSVQLVDGETVVARARSATLEVSVPTPPTFEAAQGLASGYSGFSAHAFPSCFVCGPERPDGDGLRIFPASAEPGVPVAAAWTPHASVCDANGVVREEIVWAALDCPGYFGVADLGEVAVLGRMTVDVQSRPRLDERCVLLGWKIERDGRKLHAGTALFGADGALRASSRQVWIKLTK